jgi:predicted porin
LGASALGGLHPTPSTQRTTELMSGVATASRLGFRGKEDLGGGAAAVYVAEIGYNPETGNVSVPMRQVYLGFETSDGWSLTAGRQYSPLNLSLAGSDTFLGIYWGTMHTNGGHGSFEAVGAVAGGGAHQSPSRVDNSVIAAKVSGPWTFRGMVGFGNEDSRQSGRSASAAVVYHYGPVRATAAYARIKQIAEAILPNANPRWGDEYLLGGSYDFGILRLMAGTFRYNAPDLDNASASFRSNPSGYSWKSAQTSWVGARVPLGSVGTFMVQVGQTKQKYPTNMSNGKANIVAAAYEYPLSIRTKLYASWAQKTNNEYSRLPLLGSASQLTSAGYGADLRAISTGIIHSF